MENRVIEQSRVLAARPGHLAPAVVIVDGQAGCGKTMLSPIVAALDRVELLTYAYQTEHICGLFYLGRVSLDAASSMARMWTDLQLYNIMMSREINFRPSDLSSVFHDIKPFRYFKRLFEKGDEVVPEKILKERPILHLTTHNLLGISEPIFHGLEQRVVLLEVVRHPLYMLKQQALNMERLVGDVRHFTVYFELSGNKMPFWAYGWEDLFLRSNSVERAIYSIKKMTELTEARKTYLQEKYNAKIITIPFEQFVVNPWDFMRQIEASVGTKMTPITLKMMKKQRVPRNKIADGINLKIYRRCGWEKSSAGSSEEEELKKRRDWAAISAGPKAMDALDGICAEYKRVYFKKDEC